MIGFETPKDHIIDKKNHPELEMEPERKHHHVSKQEPVQNLIDYDFTENLKVSHNNQDIPHTPLDHHTDPLHDPFL